MKEVVFISFSLVNYILWGCRCHWAWHWHPKRNKAETEQTKQITLSFRKFACHQLRKYVWCLFGCLSAEQHHPKSWMINMSHIRYRQQIGDVQEFLPFDSVIVGKNQPYCRLSDIVDYLAMNTLNFCLLDNRLAKNTPKCCCYSRSRCITHSAALCIALFTCWTSAETFKELNRAECQPVWENLALFMRRVKF